MTLPYKLTINSKDITLSNLTTITLLNKIFTL